MNWGAREVRGKALDAVDDSASEARLRIFSSVSYCDRLSNLRIRAGYEVFPVRGEEHRQCSPLITLPPAGYVPKTRRHTGGSCHTQSCYLPSIFSAFMIVSVGFISTAAVMTIGSTWLKNAASLLSSHQQENTHGESFPLALRVAFFLSDLREIINEWNQKRKRKTKQKQKKIKFLSS